MKLFLAVLILLAAILTQLYVPRDGKLAEKSAVVALPADQCYRRIVDVVHYPRWINTIKSVDANFGTAGNKVGQRFSITMDWGFLGTIEYDAHVYKADGQRTFAFRIDNWIGTQIEARISAMGDAKCRIQLTVLTGKKNAIQKYLVQPFARLYYSNWLTHTLLGFQLIYS